MRIKKHITKNTIVEIISMVFILLFVYASISKLLEFKDFQSQLGQSPLLSAFAIPTSYGIICIELVTSLLLASEKTRKWGIYFAYMLMVMFTTYIVIILNFTPFTPCTCGGVLENMGWTQHLIFNIVFIILALWSLFITKKDSTKSLAIKCIIIFLLSAGFISGLHIISKQDLKRNNAFQRTYSPHALEEIESLLLESNTFYIAGFNGRIIYLANYYAPLYLKVIDLQLKTSKDIQIEIEEYQLPYKRVRIKVTPPYFYLGDGTVPVLLKGKINDWKAKTLSKNAPFFYQYVAMDSISLAISTTSTKTNANALGILLNKKNSVKLNLQHDVLKQQINGTFDTDGLLLWNAQLQKIIYMYYYRNHYVIANKRLNDIAIGKTIDTIYQAQMDVAYYSKKNEYKLGNAILVNRFASAYGSSLYIHSDRLGKYETETILNTASIIDHYNIRDNSYIQSFYFYHQPDKKLREFNVHKNKIIGLVDNKLWIYQIKSEYHKK